MKETQFMNSNIIKEKGVSQNEALKRPHKLLAIIVLVFTLYASIPVEHECYALENNEKATPMDKLTFAGDWDEDKAIKIVNNICKEWLFSDAQGGYDIKSSFAFQRDNTRMHFFQVSASGESCRFCPGIIGAVVFSKNNRFWEVELEEEFFARFGCYGVPPEAKLIKIGSGRYGLLFQWWRSGQGGGFEHYIVLINLGNKDYSLILEEQIYQSDTSLEPRIPKIEVRTTIKGDFYDIKIGSKLFNFKNGKYKILDTQPVK